LSTGVRLGVDIGGTFTDVVLEETAGSLWECKASPTPDNYGEAVVERPLRVFVEAGLPS
jgi:N-methylhydantoinase A